MDSITQGQVPPANEDESRVNIGTLPDPLMSANGSTIRSPKDWPSQREYLLKLIGEHEYGFAPAQSAQVAWKIVESGLMFDGKTKRTQINVQLKTDAASVDVDFAVFTPTQLPKAKGCFLGLNFQGNHTVDSDPLINIPTSWVRNSKDSGIDDNRATARMRGIEKDRWPIEEINQRGYAVATAYYGDIDPDFDDGFKNGVHAMYPEHRVSPEHPNRWGSIAGWAWGMSRLLDVLVQLPEIDASHVAAVGHSRLGKTALWAGANDTRFSIVISNNSGCGGAALERRNFGETVARINSSFPHWFCQNFRKYNQNEAALPFDQHALIASIAPRPVYISSATKDLWADPKGEYLSGWYAGPVFQLLGFEGLPTAEPPKPDVSVGDRIGYHNRTGDHDILIFDWQQFMNFADRHWK